MRPRYISLSPFVHWTNENRPIPWQQVFGRSAQLEVEIGFGLGDFLVRQALENPEKDFVGVELGWVPVRRALRKIALAGVENVRVLRADATVAFERIFLERSLQRVWALFPCPWPKRRHVRFRFFSQSFLMLLNSRLKRDGEILIVTDYSPYFDWIMTQVPGTGLEAHAEKVSPRFLTKYERKWKELGQKKFHQLVLRKREHQQIPLKEDTSMITHRVGNFDPYSFRPANDRGEIVVEFKDFLYDSKRLKGMVRSVVGEDNLVQDIWIEIARGEKDWHIRPAKGCSIIPTAGVQRALDLVWDSAGG